MVDARFALERLSAEIPGRFVGPSPDGTIISGVVIDSRQAHPGVLFAAVRGANTDGHDHAAQAVERGAVALLVERPLDLDIAQYVVDDTRRVLGSVSAAVWDHPDQAVAVMGVTGTNGKTSIVTMVQQLGDALGISVRSVGTLTGARTTPEAPDLFRQLAEAHRDGVSVLAMEVSSHALAMSRVTGVEFRLAVFTNLGHDHLDFHGDVESYFAAKAALFTTARPDHSLVNVDDAYGRRLVADIEGAVTTYSLGDIDDVRRSRDGASFRWRDQTVETSLVGEHNLSNLLAVLEAAVVGGLAPSRIAAAARHVRGAPGRFEMVPPADDILVIVDYAHTPDALAAVAKTARDLLEDGGKLWIVFGCGGDRDQAKRPAMGAVATTLADRVILTNDNPRSEDPADIVADIVAGIGADSAPYDIVYDRAEAVDRAVLGASPGDVVLIAGKGHELTQTIGSLVTPFEDRVAAAESLRRRSARDGGESA